MAAHSRQLAALAALAALALLCLFTPTGAISARRFTKEEVLSEGATWNEKEGRFAWWNETVDDVMAAEHGGRRSALGYGDSAPVSVTFYNSPGMDCTDGLGQCGYGSDVTGPAVDSSGNRFLQTSLYPLHVASGNFGFLGGCGACGILSGPNGISMGYVVTDVTDTKDDLNRDASGWPPYGSHIDTCLPQFQLYQPGTTGYSGGIFTGTWTRINCNSLGAPDMPTNNVVIRFEAWNQWAKAVVISRLGGLGVVVGVNFYTAQDNNGGNSGNGNPVLHQGYKVAGWGAWWSPDADLSGQGGVGLEVTLEDGTVLRQNGYPMPDYSLWQTGQIFNFFQNVT